MKYKYKSYKEIEKIEEKWDTYNQCETLIKTQMLTTMPKSIAIKVQGLPTGKARWDALWEKHEEKALTVIVDLECRMFVWAQMPGKGKCEDSHLIVEHNLQTVEGNE